MANGTEGADRFEISSVISRAFEAIGANFLLYLGLALVFSGIPTFALSWWQNSRLGPGGAVDPQAVFTMATWMPVLISWAVGVVSNAVLQAALTRATVMHLSGEKPGFAQCLTVGVTMILPMIAIGFISTIGVALAMLLLIVPGIMLSLAWSVIVPVYVQERVGLLETFGRSLELTRGARWRILLVMIILTIGAWLLTIPTGIVVAMSRGMESPLVVASFTAVIGALSAMVTVSILASIYVELRNVKEGVAPNELESIFA